METKIKAREEMRTQRKVGYGGGGGGKCMQRKQL